MKCFKCNNPDLDMVKLNDYVLVCPLCNMKFDKELAEHTEKELLEVGYFYMANEPLAEQFFDYLRSKDLEVSMIRDGIQQWFYINEEGRVIVEKHFIDVKLNTENRLNQVKGILMTLR